MSRCRRSQSYTGDELRVTDVRTEGRDNHAAFYGDQLDSRDGNSSPGINDNPLVQYAVKDIDKRNRIFSPLHTHKSHQAPTRESWGRTAQILLPCTLTSSFILRPSKRFLSESRQWDGTAAACASEWPVRTRRPT